MIEWLQGFSGTKSSGINMERIELENLRKEISKYKNKYHEDHEMIVKTEESEHSDKEDQDKVDELLYQKQLKTKGKGGRSSVSAEVYGKYYNRDNFIARVIEKSASQIERIKNIVGKSFMFNNLDDKDTKTIIDAMDESKFRKDDIVITQGEHGDILYLIEEGDLKCYRKMVNI